MISAFCSPHLQQKIVQSRSMRYWSSIQLEKKFETNPLVIEDTLIFRSVSGDVLRKYAEKSMLFAQLR